MDEKFKGFTSGKHTERQAVRELDSEKPFKILLHFARHGKKDGPNDVDFATDVKMPMTKLGHEQARSLASKAETEYPLAVGGERRRLRETALRAVTGNDTSLPEDADFFALQELLDPSGERYGNRIWKIKGLDFALDKSLPEFNAIEERTLKGEYFRKLAELDDENRGDSVYARHAYGVARIVEWAAKASPKLRQRYQLHEERNQAAPKDGPVREAFVSPQGGVSESFLAEIILRTKGPEEREKFIAAVPNGFKETKGFDAEIVSDTIGTKVHIAYEAGEGEKAYTYNEDVPLEVVSDIVRDFGPKEV